MTGLIMRVLTYHLYRSFFCSWISFLSSFLFDKKTSCDRIIPTRGFKPNLKPNHQGLGFSSYLVSFAIIHRHIVNIPSR